MSVTSSSSLSPSNTQAADPHLRAKEWTARKDICSSRAIRVQHILYDHPTVRKVAKIAAYLFGAGIAVAGVAMAAAFSPSIPAVVGCLVGGALSGALIAGVTYAVSRVLDCMHPMRHEMKNHAFTPDKLEKNGELLGELYYDGDVPVLKIETQDPYEAGYTQGWLLRKSLTALRRNIEFVLFTLDRRQRPAEIQAVLESVKAKVPERFLRELEGLVDGYNAKKGLFAKSVTVDDLLFMQLMPDDMYFDPKKIDSERAQALSQTVACTLTALHDEKGVPVMARTMDWPSFGNAGALSLIVSRKNPNTGIRIAEVTIPGLMGTLTGVNSEGLSVAMNVTGYVSEIDTIEGIPSIFYNRLVLENCRTFGQAKTFVNRHQPLGPYHLTVADKTKAGTFSMYQEEEWDGEWQTDKDSGHKLRMLKKERPLITTNCSCTPRKCDMFMGLERKRRIKEYLAENNNIGDSRQVLKGTQSLPWVNNHLTTHRVLMGAHTLEVALDNAWAGDQKLHAVDLTRVFGS